jgi:hypothetical protein
MLRLLILPITPVAIAFVHIGAHGNRLSVDGDVWSVWAARRGRKSSRLFPLDKDKGLSLVILRNSAVYVLGERAQVA